MTQRFALLLAPAGAGKTGLIQQFYSDNIYQKILFISPLSALSSELSVRFAKEKGILSPGNRAEAKEFLKVFNSKSRAFFISTPELLIGQNLELISEETLIILDEFHLYYYWGNSFRPGMWEFFYEVSQLRTDFLGLTATCDKKILKEVKRDFINQFDHLIILDMGNQLINNPPRKNNYFPKKSLSWLRTKMLYDLVLTDLKMLIFVPRRDEVDEMLIFFKRQNIEALGCVGGEAKKFTKELEERKLASNTPRVIVTTSALSHGVNLPPVNRVYITYPLNNKDFWVQMTARAGRQGEEFEVISQDKQGPYTAFYKSYIQYLLNHLYYSFRLWWYFI